MLLSVAIFVYKRFLCTLRDNEIFKTGQISQKENNPKQTMILGHNPKCKQHLESLIFIPSILNISTEFLYFSED